MMAPSEASQQLKKLFEVFGSSAPSDNNLFVERCIYDQVHQAASEAPGVSYEDAIIANRPCIWVRPANASSKHVMLFMHGGGFTVGSPNGHRKLAGHLANASGCLGVSVDYRLSPEYKYPAALEDCVNVYKYLLENGYEAGNIFLAGDSCGGGLTASVSLSAIKQGLPVPAACVALSPWYDMTTQDGGTNDSNEQNDVLQTKVFVKELVRRYLEGTDAKTNDPLISPLHASQEDIKKLPPFWISAAGYDMLRDHAERFAKKLEDARVEVVLEIHAQQQHVMEFMAGKAPEANDSVNGVGKWIKKKFDLQ